LSTSAGELVVAVLAVEEDAVVPEELLLVVVVVAGVLAALVLAAVDDVPEVLVVVVLAPRLWPKAWNTASMKDLKLVAGLALLRAALLPSLSPSLSCDCVAVVLWTALVPEVPAVPVGPELVVNPAGVNQLILLLPYAFTFIAIPFTRCAPVRGQREKMASWRLAGYGR
jgi:hypothetical protein